jgi:predicted protein tyrosine phosphatase
MNILFICNQNRSKTAEEIFKTKFNTKSAGLYNSKPVTKSELSWADVVMVMEDKQRTEIARRFPKHYMQKRILSLDVPDIYQFKNPVLIEELKLKFSEFESLLT